MNLENLIAVKSIASHYELEIIFFENLNDLGIIEIITVNEEYYLEHDMIIKVEKVIRIHKDLDINTEGIAVVLNLLEKIDMLEQELNAAKNSLRLYH